MSVASCLTVAQLVVSFQSSFNRREHPVLEGALEAEWARRLAANPRLFSALKFRFHSMEPHAGGAWRMNLGLTDYREFIGTNMAPHAAQLLADGARDVGSAAAYMVGSRLSMSMAESVSACACCVLLCVVCCVVVCASAVRRLGPCGACRAMPWASA